jgi:hypothetical protein
MKLIKDKEGYSLCIEENGDNSRNFIATTDGMYVDHKLSKQNCDKIFGVVDVRKLADVDFTCEIGEGPTTNTDINSMIRKSYLNGAEFGYNKAMELQKDKLFTANDMMQAIITTQVSDAVHNNEDRLELIQSLQQPTEIDVEIEMEKVVDETKMVGVVKGVKGSGNKITTYKSVPKLDENGCLILTKKK